MRRRAGSSPASASFAPPPAVAPGRTGRGRSRPGPAGLPVRRRLDRRAHAPEPIPAGEPTLPPPDSPAVVVSARRPRPPKPQGRRKTFCPRAAGCSRDDHGGGSAALGACRQGRRDRPHRGAFPTPRARGARGPLRPGAPSGSRARRSRRPPKPSCTASRPPPRTGSTRPITAPDVAACAPAPEDWAETRSAQRRRDPLRPRRARRAHEPPRSRWLVTPTLTLPGAEEVLATLGAAADADAALASYNLPHPATGPSRHAWRSCVRPSVPMVQVLQGARSGSACARPARAAHPRPLRARRAGRPRQRPRRARGLGGGRFPAREGASGERRAHAADRGSPVRRFFLRGGSRATSSPT